MNDLILLLGGKCALCHKPYPDGRVWTIHHRRYRKGEKTYKDFVEKIPHVITRGKNKGKKTTKKIYHKNEYLKYLTPIVQLRPEDFAAMHHWCHQSVTKGARWSKINGNRQRYCDLIMQLD